VAGKPLPEGRGELRRGMWREVEAAKAAHAWSAESWRYGTVGTLNRRDLRVEAQPHFSRSLGAAPAETSKEQPNGSLGGVPWVGRASTRITTVPLLSVQKKEILQDYSLAQQARKKSLSHNTDESGPLWREPRARAPRRGGHWEEDEKKYGQIEKKTENNDVPAPT